MRLPVRKHEPILVASCSVLPWRKTAVAGFSVSSRLPDYANGPDERKQYTASNSPLHRHKWKHVNQSNHENRQNIQEMRSNINELDEVMVLKCI